MTTKLDRKVLIEAAFKKLPISEGKDELLAIAIDRLANIEVTSLGTAPPQFTKIGSVRTKKELNRLARKNSNIEKCLKELHEPAILALANHGHCRDPNVPPDTVRRIAKKTAADIEVTPKDFTAGRAKNNLVKGVAHMLACDYAKLTGKNPTIGVNFMDSTAYGPFMNLVADVFAALGIKGSAEAAARAAIIQFNEVKPSKQSSQDENR